LQLEKNAIKAVQLRQKGRIDTADVPQEVVTHTERIAMLGRKYGTFVEPWVDSGLFREARPKLDPASPACYLSDVAKRQGRVAELYQHVPEISHESMKDHSFFSSMASVLACLIIGLY
jgi:hypothetical protein